jgi:hypothetical protein
MKLFRWRHNGYKPFTITVLAPDTQEARQIALRYISLAGGTQFHNLYIHANEPVELETIRPQFIAFVEG